MVKHTLRAAVLGFGCFALLGACSASAQEAPPDDFIVNVGEVSDLELADARALVNEVIEYRIEPFEAGPDMLIYPTDDGAIMFYDSELAQYVTAQAALESPGSVVTAVFDPGSDTLFLFDPVYGPFSEASIQGEMLKDASCPVISPPLERQTSEAVLALLSPRSRSMAGFVSDN